MGREYKLMDPAVKEDWVEALRSGEFIQGLDCLDKEDRQCPLGVLCDILDLEFKTYLLFAGSRHAVRYRGYLGEYLGGYQIETKILPIHVREQAKLDPRAETSIIRMNDEHNATFEEIADWIEVYL